MPKFIPGSGNPNARLMIVGEAPGEIEEQLSDTLVGPTGKDVKQWVEAAGMSWEATYRTNVCHYRPPNNDLRRLKEIGISLDDQIQNLFTEIRAIKPNAILALGNTALHALVGIKGINKYRGSILSLQGHVTPKVIPTIHPAALYKGDKWGTKDKTKTIARYYIKLDIKRAVEESKFPELNLPNRTIDILTSARQVYELKRDLFSRTNPIVAMDFETPKTIPGCMSFAPSSTYAAVIPLLNLPFAIGYVPIPISELVEIYSIIDEILRNPNIRFVGHNFIFDHYKARRIGWKIANVFGDTLVAAHVLHPETPKDLGFLSSIYTREPFYKDEGKDFDLTKIPIKQWFNYNGKDSLVTREMIDVHLDELRELGLLPFFNYLMQLHHPYIEMMEVGIDLDEETRVKLFTKYMLLKARREREAFTIIGEEFNPRSPKQVKDTLTRFGFPLRDKYDEESLTALWANHADSDKKKRVLNCILDLRKIYKTISNYLGSPPDWDGKQRCVINPYGTDTGRSSTQNMGGTKRGKSNPYRQASVAWSFHTVTKHGDLGADLRRMLVAPLGWSILEADLRQAEPRICALLSEDYELLEKFETLDIHRWTAKLVLDLNKSLEDITEEERFIGKTSRNAGNLGVGKRTLTAQINTDAMKYNILGTDGLPIRISEYQGGKVLDRFHAFTPRIQVIFHRQTILALENNNRTLFNAFGRRRQFFEHWGEDLFKRAFAYLTQSHVKDHVGNSMLRLQKRREELGSAKLFMEYHDALLFLVEDGKIETVKRIITEELEQTIDFSKCSLPRKAMKIPVEIKVGKNYKDMVKV